MGGGGYHVDRLMMQNNQNNVVRTLKIKDKPRKVQFSGWGHTQKQDNICGAQPCVPFALAASTVAMLMRVEKKRVIKGRKHM